MVPDLIEFRRDVAKLTKAWDDGRLSPADKQCIGFVIELIRFGAIRTAVAILRGLAATA